MSDDIDPAFKAAWRESQGQPVDAEPRTNYIAEAITEAFGERCPDYEPGCHCCEAWKQYDALAAVSQEPAPVGYVTPDSIREVAAGNIGNHLFPKGTLRPENEIPVYAAPVPPVVGEDAPTVTDAEIKAFRAKYRDIFPGSHPDRQTIIELLTVSKEAARAGSEAFRAALSASSVAMPVGGQTVLPVAVELGRKAVRGSTIATETQGLIRDPLQNYVTIEDALSALAQPAQGWRDPEGWKLVPVEPNEAMLSIGVGGAHGLKRQIWKAMLAAAPAPVGGAEHG